MSALATSSDQCSAEDQALEVQKLFNQIKILAANKDFLQAEALREKLIELHPMSLREIIDSAEIIEKEKGEGIDQDHLALWDKLYSTLNEEEKSCFYYSLRKFIIPPKRKILSKGAFNNRLYFIEKGEVVIYKTKGDKNVVVAKLGRGSLLGEYTFSTITLCSASVISSEEVHVRCLKGSETDDWEEKHPGLLHKIITFCESNGHLDDIERARKQAKWKYPRHSVVGRVKASLLAKDGSVNNAHFNGSVTEIARDGTCFEINCSKKKTARALLAKNLSLSYTFGKDEQQEFMFTVTGKVVRVSFNLHNDYSVHIRFHKILNEELIDNIAAIFKPIEEDEILQEL